uniref:Uncharacterized protein n=1 Tax=Anas zonorhyncha TaxID=75864 RepID=A0A8B9ZSC5_9AVES
MPEDPQAHAWCCLLKPWLFQIAWGRLQPFPARAESRCQHFSCRAQAEHAVPQLKLIFFFFFFPSDHTSELIPTSPFLTPNGSKNVLMTKNCITSTAPTAISWGHLISRRSAGSLAIKGSQWSWRSC